MTNRRTRMFGARVGVLVALGALSATGVALAHPAGASTTPVAPTLSAKVKYSTVTLAWSEPKSAKRTVEMQRLDGTTWTGIMAKAVSGRSGHLADTKSTTMVVTYQARVTEAGVASPWTQLVVDTSPKYESGTSACPDGWADRGIAALNQFRHDNGVDASQRVAVTDEIHLLRLATARASHIAHTGTLSHAGFSQSLYKKWGYPYANEGSIAENSIALGEPEDAVRGWASSPEHRANMLHRTVDAGFGCAIDSHGVAFYMLDMGATILSPG